MPKSFRNPSSVTKSHKIQCKIGKAIGSKRCQIHLPQTQTTQTMHTKNDANTPIHANLIILHPCFPPQNHPFHVFISQSTPMRNQTSQAQQQHPKIPNPKKCNTEQNECVVVVQLPTFPTFLPAVEQNRMVK